MERTVNSILKVTKKSEKNYRTFSPVWRHPGARGSGSSEAGGIQPKAGSSEAGSFPLGREKQYFILDFTPPQINLIREFAL